MIADQTDQARPESFRLLDEEVAMVSGSVFSGGGIGDVGIEWGLDIPVMAACEIVPSRAELIRRNFPDTKVFEGDVWKLGTAYVEFMKKKLGGLRPWLITLSPPCQGMSANGAGRISSAIRSGNRPQEDERNRLVLPGLEIVEALQPDWFLLENVRRMQNTVIRNEHGEPENILDLLARRLHPLGYTIRSSILDFRNYGVPHHRQRLITVGCRLPAVKQQFPQADDVFFEEPTELHPAPTHGGSDLPSPVTLREAIGQLPSLDASHNFADPNDPYHRVPRWNERQYYWMKHTPEGGTAFDNHQCPSCGKDAHASEDVTCRGCSKPLPKPTISNKGSPRLVRGFRTSYRRMKWDQPASTLTMNSGVISSDVKGHPDQNRVLSLREILLLGTLDNPRWKQRYQFEGVPFGRPVPGMSFSPKLVRQVIGESIPPLAMTRIVERLVELDERM